MKAGRRPPGALTAAAAAVRPSASHPENRFCPSPGRAPRGLRSPRSKGRVVPPAQNQARGGTGTRLPAPDRTFSKPKWGHPPSQKDAFRTDCTRCKSLIARALASRGPRGGSGTWPRPQSPAGGVARDAGDVARDAGSAAGSTNWRGRSLADHGNSGEAPAGKSRAAGVGPTSPHRASRCSTYIRPARGCPPLPRSRGHFRSPPPLSPPSVRRRRLRPPPSPRALRGGASPVRSVVLGERACGLWRRPRPGPSGRLPELVRARGAGAEPQGEWGGAETRAGWARACSDPLLPFRWR